MKLIGLISCLAILVLIAGCASTSIGPSPVSPGALSGPEGCQVDDDCTPCPAGECDVTCEPLPDGTCLVTCWADGEIVCQEVCVPCDPEDCDPECATACEGVDPGTCTPGGCGS